MTARMVKMMTARMGKIAFITEVHVLPVYTAGVKWAFTSLICNQQKTPTKTQKKNQNFNIGIVSNLLLESQLRVSLKMAFVLAGG